MKKIIAGLLLVLMFFVFAGCGNMDMLDTTYTYDYAIISFPDGTVKKIEIKKWCDYEGEQIQIESKDGKIYLVNSMNCVLVQK